MFSACNTLVILVALNLPTNPLVFLDREAVGHAGDVIADGAVEADLAEAALGAFAHETRVGGVRAAADDAVAGQGKCKCRKSDRPTQVFDLPGHCGNNGGMSYRVIDFTAGTNGD